MFVIIDSVGTMINTDVNAKHWLIKEDVIKDLFGILVLCECEWDKSCDLGQYLDYENCKYRKKLIGKLIEELKILMEMK